MPRFPLALLAAAAASLAVAAPVDAADNIARGKTYTFSPAPNYPLCTDEGDPTDLTDGVVEPGISAADRATASSLWGKKSAVGWTHARPLSEITIDLGKVEPIAGLSFHTASGASGVSAARSIAILVSDDGETFRYVGDLVALSEAPLPPPYPGYDVYSYATDELKTKGRYVRLAFIARGPYGFVDEIEVYRGDAAWLDQAVEGETMTVEQLTDRLRLTRLGIQSRVKRDVQTLEEMIQTLSVSEHRQRLEEKVDAVRQQIDGMTTPDDAEMFRAILPLNDVHASIYALYGQMLADAGKEPLTVWHTPPHEILGTFEMPRQPVETLEVAMMGNERRSEAFNLTNASAQPRDVTFSIEGLTGGPNPPYLKAYQVEPVDTRPGKVVPAALTPLEADAGVYTTTVPAGMTRQVWIAAETYDQASPGAGDHAGTIRLASGDFTHEIDLKLHVAPLTLPENDRFSFMMWDYIFDQMYGISEGNRQAARQHMLDDPLVNGVWGGQQTIPFPAGTDSEGNLTGEIDFALWDDFVRFWPGMKHYFVFAAWHPTTAFAGHALGTPQADRAMAQWAAAWAEHNRSLGLEPGQVVILFVDEPVGEDYLRASYLAGKAFGSGTDDILTFTDPNHHSPDQPFGMENIAAYDIVCPHLPHFGAATPEAKQAFEAVPGQDKQLWFYSCSGPSRVYDLAYFRLQPWHAFARGGTGGGFWAFAPSVWPDSWNEYAAGWVANYALAYVGPEGITGSKQWEAASQGVQDFLYLSMLAERVGDDEAAQRKLEQLIAPLVEKGTGAWESENNLSAQAERSRLEVLRWLEKLESEGAVSDR